MRRVIHFSAWPFVILFLVGCGAVVGPDDRRRVGVIDFYDQPSVIEVPDTVRAGEEFQVSVRTYGGGCVSHDTTEVAVSGRLAQVVPYDLHSGQDACADVLRTIDHQTAVRFDEPGDAEVRVVGRRLPENTIIAVMRSVVVEEL